MYTMTIWNQDSTNYGANAFINENGTDTIEFESLEETMHLMSHLISNPQIDKIVVECYNGSLTWTQCLSTHLAAEEALGTDLPDDCFDDDSGGDEYDMDKGYC